jgi:hypothetical protein
MVFLWHFMSNYDPSLIRYNGGSLWFPQWRTYIPGKRRLHVSRGSLSPSDARDVRAHVNFYALGGVPPANCLYGGIRLAGIPVAWSGDLVTPLFSR